MGTDGYRVAHRSQGYFIEVPERVKRSREDSLCAESLLVGREMIRWRDESDSLCTWFQFQINGISVLPTGPTGIIELSVHPTTGWHLNPCRILIDGLCGFGNLRFRRREGHPLRFSAGPIDYTPCGDVCSGTDGVENYVVSSVAESEPYDVLIGLGLVTFWNDLFRGPLDRQIELYIGHRS